MGSFSEFAATLEKKIRREIEREQFARTAGPAPTPLSRAEEPAPGFAWLLGEGVEFTRANEPSRARQAYGVRPKPRPAHVLNPAQQAAYEVFQSAGTQLPPGFSKAELKAAWRQMAKATHPDHGGEASTFREAKAALECLQGVFQMK